jgi:hypothetical protein
MRRVHMLSSDVKVGIAAAGFLGCQILFLVFREVIERRTNRKFAQDAANRIPALLHGTLLSIAGHAVVVRCAGVAATDCTPLASWAEAAGAFSTGYMMWDLLCMQQIGYEHAVPLSLHHAASAAACVLVIYWCPEGLWFMAALMMTETTVPFENAAWLLNWRRDCGRGAQHGGGALGASRRLLLLVWVLYRILLFVPYFKAVVGSHAAVRAASYPLLCTVYGMGAVLTAFNIGGLLQVVLPNVREDRQWAEQKPSLRTPSQQLGTPRRNPRRTVRVGTPCKSATASH